jgi:hypothetical protein
LVDFEEYEIGDSEITIQPLAFGLEQNFPNPFNPITSIRFTIPESGNVNIRIYNVRGQLVRNLTDEYMSKGTHIVRWHGDNDNGRSVGSGIYFIRLQSETNVAIRRALMLK